ncbi:MAG: primosomal protein N' [Chitinivibrionia bacterium]|nr:primosomal protein N' [Chitinivibrionia bacterium]
MDKLESPASSRTRVFAKVALPIPADKLFTYEVPFELAGQISPGSRVEVPLGKRIMSGIAVELSSEAEAFETKSVLSVSGTYLPPELMRLTEWVASYYGCTFGEAAQSVLPPSFRRSASRRPARGAKQGYDSPLDALERDVLELTGAQRTALTSIEKGILSGAFNAFLLHGVTGSGKTEVYIRAARLALSRGGGCIVLVPEISLLPQAIARYRKHFQDELAVIHSRLTGAERRAIWESISDGTRRIVLGPRSALFSPVRDLRLVIVDEEQDDSYKQEEKPRYNARSVALMRGTFERLTVVLGSATPSAETYRHAGTGTYARLLLSKRIRDIPLPSVEIIDMRREDPETGIFSRLLLERLEACMRRGSQSLLFLNKRGHARFVQCRKCGWVPQCANCDITLTYHRVGAAMRCHYCGFAQPAVKQCPECGSPNISFSGFGTQRIELDLKGLFPGVRILRMDADTTRGKEGHRKILEQFGAGRHQVLLGTQMVTKGHHFPGVHLVGVLSAEEELNFPDFRSAERTFQQLVQVSGRAGREEQRGEVLVQTFIPEHTVFSHLKTHDYDGFMAEELAVRRKLNYPPFSRLVSALCAGGDRGVVSAVAAEWSKELRRLFREKQVDVLGPAPPLVARLKGRFREHILLKGSLSLREKTDALGGFARVAGEIKGGRAVELKWDVDPQSFY